MLKKGNGDPDVCVDNLLAMREGECPLDRMRGLRTDMIDRAVDIEDIESDILDTLEAYEPRAEIGNVEASIGASGDLEIEIAVTPKYENEDDMTDEEKEEEALEGAVSDDEGG